LPYYNVGIVKNATKEALINIENIENNVLVKIHVTAVYENAFLTLTSKNNTFYTKQLNISPENGFEELIDISGFSYQDLVISLKDNLGKILVEWKTEVKENADIPKPAIAAKEPKEIETLESLYLQGLHLEQYRHATFSPTDYYKEGLERNPTDVRCNNAIGLWYLKKGQLTKSLNYFDKAIASLTIHNPNPYNGEPYFNKGLALNFLGKKDQAYESFFKACWNAQWQDAGYFNLAQIDCFRGNYEKAIDLIDRALIKNWHNHKARHLKVILLRKTNKLEEANALIVESLKIDKFNFGILYERFLISKKQSDLSDFKEIIRNYNHNYIEFAIDYAIAGQYDEAVSLLNIHLNENQEVYPMVYYFMGWFYEQKGDVSEALNCYSKAQKTSFKYCFPNKIEEVIALQSASKLNPLDAKAFYYLGNFWYAAKQYDEAQECWEASVEIDDNFAITHRNLALLYFNKRNDKELSRKHLEKAFFLDSKDARLLMELDQFYKKINLPVKSRLEFLESHLDLTISRDDLYLERISLYNILGEYDKASKLLKSRQFHPWEGGEGKVIFQYITSQIELAKNQINLQNFDNAISLLYEAKEYPLNLGEGKLLGTQENDIDYWLGCAYECLGEMEKANGFFELASKGLSTPSPAIFYNDQQPDKIFYQGLALQKLNRQLEANIRFENLINYGLLHLNDTIKLDYFAISLPDLLIWEVDLNDINKIHCNYLIGLGKLGLGEHDESIERFQKVIQMDLFHIPAHIHSNLTKDLAV
jgi:tetratricopeptide (TPR) repeat protein